MTALAEWPTDENGWIVKPNGKRYIPTIGQGRFHEDPAVIRLLVGGRGSGKTAAGTQEASKKIMKGEPGLILAPDAEHFKRATWPQFNEWIPVDPDLTGLPMSPLIDHWSKGDKMIRFKTGSTVWYGGIRDPDSWRGPNVNWIWYDEPGRHAHRTSFLVPLGALRVGEDLKMWLTTTPRGVLHWLYPLFVLRDLGDDVLDALVEGGFERDPSLLVSWQRTSTYDNKENLNPIFFATLLATYQGKWREQELDGSFVSFEGLVYDCWNPEVHLVDFKDVGMQSWWPKWRVIDFGYKNPFVCQWWTRNPEGEYFRYRELYYSQRTVREHALAINHYSEGETYIDTIADWDAEDRATLEESDIYTVPASKGISAGVQLVYRLLTFDNMRKPDLYFVKDALVERDPLLVAEELPTCTEEEFTRYAWPQDKEGRPRKEQPLDLYNHGMDCLQYFSSHVEGDSGSGMETGMNPFDGYRG